MIILGIDPGSTRAGYGVINFPQKGGQKPEFIDGGIIQVFSKDKSQRLVDLKNSLIPIIKKFSPNFFALSLRSEINSESISAFPKTV